MRVRRFSLMRVRDEEHGAVLAIVAISFICLIGMLVLTFDLGRGVALKRNMVNGADSAALAAAMECGMAHGETAARAEATNLLADNNAAATVTGFQINPGPAQCDGAPSPDPDHNPTVTVTVTVPQDYFFAPIFGINNGTVVASATAEWTVGETNPAPIRIEGVKLDECLAAGEPDAEGRVDCYFTFEGTGGQWGWLNLPQGWPIKGQDPNPKDCASNKGGTNELEEYIAGMGGMGSPGSPTLSGSLLWDPTGAGNPPTWVCAANGRIDDARDAMEQWIINVTASMKADPTMLEPQVQFPVVACNGAAPPCYVWPTGSKAAYPVIKLQRFYVKEVFKGRQEVTKNCGVKPKSGSVFCLHLQTTGLDDSSAGGRPIVRLVG
jgi:Flp pilus assembly protein TadG